MYFKSSTLGSFFRQLNLYHFYRLSDSRKKEYKNIHIIQFKNEYFIKDHPELLTNIRRQKVKCYKPKKKTGQNNDDSTKLDNLENPLLSFDANNDNNQYIDNSSCLHLL
ncbi:hypothetical protein K502DRAFT_339104 [Neoconidiobolus thromboides FSU 785]|nr:hypothetical protein K502DRAFT_339104 [Neoconidiobolus thromboides FSU 785]